MAIEAKRGCGFRKCGGFYLVAGKPSAPCHRFPLPLHVCPTCNQGIKQSRGWTWVKKALFQPDCTDSGCRQGVGHMALCPACNTTFLPDDIGLIWIGERFYKKPNDFLREANMMGISRRVKKVPRGFKIGEDWVFLAHPKAIAHTVMDSREGKHGQLEAVSTDYVAGVIAAFKPERIETLMFKKDITKKKREELEKKGIHLIEVPNGDKDHAGSVYDKEEATSDD